MLYAEFVSYVKRIDEEVKAPSFEDYDEVIEVAYNWHPALSYSYWQDPKKKIAELYVFGENFKIGGVKLIKDTILPIALERMELEMRRDKLRKELEAVDRAIDEMESKYMEE